MSQPLTEEQVDPRVKEGPVFKTVVKEAVKQMQGTHPSNKVTLENLDEVVFWHKPNDAQVESMKKIANACKHFMQTILENVPDCADRSAALRSVREARMMSNAAIAMDPATKAPIDPERSTTP